MVLAPGDPDRISYDRALKRLRPNSYRAKKRSEPSTRHNGPATIKLGHLSNAV